MLFSRNKLDMANIEGNIILPLRVDKTPSGKIVKCADIGQDGYFINVEYSLQISAAGDVLVLSYYGENDTVLNESEFKQVIDLFNK